MKNNQIKKALSFTEFLVVISIIGVLFVILTMSVSNVTSQRQFDSKIQKTASSLAAILQKEHLMNIGGNFDAEEISTIINNNYKVETNCGTNNIPNACWSNANINDSNIEGSYTILLEDKTSIAVFPNNNIDIYIDANGPLPPNIFEQDIQYFDNINRLLRAR